MPNSGHYWKAKDIDQLVKDYDTKPPHISDLQWCAAWGKPRGLSSDAVRSQVTRAKLERKLNPDRVRVSTYPVYDNPLTMEGDALVLPDIEFPFHHAEFVNACLDLADAWGIKQLILAGDALHFDSLTGFAPAWVDPDPGGITSDIEALLMSFAKTLSSRKQGEMMTMIGDIGQRTERDGLSSELRIARAEMERIARQFDRVDFVIGNHEGRFLRKMETALDPAELLRLLEVDTGKWRIAPFYYSYLDTPGGRYTIEHPKNCVKGVAKDLAAKYHTHVIMAHNHHVIFQFDISGNYYAIEAGHCVDEARLPYAAQRHNRAPAHALGGVIVRDGYPWLLSKATDWKRLQIM